MSFEESLIEGFSDLYGGIQARNLDRQQFDRQMAFNQRQSETQYQRAVEDMKAAGLNPMLAAIKGGNAALTAPGWSGASNVVGSAVSRYLNNEIADSQINSANAAARKANAEAAITEEVGLEAAKANVEKTLTDTALSAQQIDKFMSDIELNAAKIATEKEMPDKLKAMTDLLEAQTQTEEFKQLNFAQQNKLLAEQTKFYAASAGIKEEEFKAAGRTASKTAEMVKPLFDRLRDIFEIIGRGRRILRR